MIAARKVGVAYQTNYDQVWIGAGKNVVEIDKRLVFGNSQFFILTREKLCFIFCIGKAQCASLAPFW